MTQHPIRPRHRPLAFQSLAQGPQILRLPRPESHAPATGTPVPTQIHQHRPPSRVGKMHGPQWFIENQDEQGGNPHDQLDDPLASAAILQAHVDEGLKLARRYRLPRPLADFIPEHQGTLKMGYFLHRAREQDPAVPEELFRYRGPTPRSRETAILMLADGCEAAVRRVLTATPGVQAVNIDLAAQKVEVTGDAALPARLVAAGKKPDEIVEELYLSAYSRLPTVDERKAAEAEFAREGAKPRAVAEDLLWAMLNTPEFVYSN